MEALQNRVKIVYEGETVDAEEMQMTPTSESVGVYLLGDGAVIELKHEVKTVYRLCDKKKEDGTPIYVVTGEVRMKTDRASGQDTK